MKKSKPPGIGGLLAAVCVGALALWLASAPPPKPTPPVRAIVAQVPVQEPESTAPEQFAPEGEEQPLASLPAVSAPAVILPPGHKPEIAIIIDDMGLNLAGSARAVKLPSAITLSYMPYADRLDEQTAGARAAGHELLLHMPMEPIGRQDPGPGALLVDLPPDEIRARLDHALGSFDGFDGVNNHMGSKFTADAPGMEIVMNELQKRNLFFLDSRTSAQSVGLSIAEAHHLPTVARDVFLDDSTMPDDIKAQLAATERVAKRQGYAIAIGHPHENTLAALEEWIPQAEQDGFELVPVHALVKTP
jgi:polysaccharide deacetylase 2 family uncharacterized protein YibQ